MVSVYVASGLENWKRARRINDVLRAAGIQITYDWTVWGEKIFGETGVADQSQIRAETDLRETAENEIRGVLSADLILALLPGGRGTHFELGLAYAMLPPGRVIIVMDMDTAKVPTSFHYLDRFRRVQNDDEAIQLITKLDSSQWCTRAALGEGIGDKLIRQYTCDRLISSSHDQTPGVS